MPGAVFLEGERLTLRTVEPDDYGFVARHRNDPDARHAGLQGLRSPLHEHDVGTIVTEHEDYHLFLACRDDTPVGSSFLLDIDFAGRKAELGYWIAPEERGKGYATEAAELGLVHGFDELGLHKIWARTVAENEASQRVLEKLGFRQEGVLREHYYGFQDYVDECRFGLLASER